jgi:predicted transcriptional regulator
MSTKLTDMICYRLDSELKAKLLNILKSKNKSLSNFHRDIVETVIVDTELTLSMLQRDKRSS